MRARRCCYGRLFSLWNFGLLIQKGSGRITLTTIWVGVRKIKKTCQYVTSGRLLIALWEVRLLFEIFFFKYDRKIHSGLSVMLSKLL